MFLDISVGNQLHEGMCASKNILIPLIKSLDVSDEKQTLRSFETFFLKIILFSFIENVEKHCPKSLAEITLICKIFKAGVYQVSTALH